MSVGCGWRNCLQLWKVAAHILNKKPQTNDKGWSSSLGVGRGANPFTVKNKFVTKIMRELWTWTDSLDSQPKRRNMDMTFGLWNVRSLYRAGSLMTVLRKLSKYKLDLVGVQEVRWEGGGTEPVGECSCFYRKGNENH
jgi:hypothetical protein